MRRSRMQLNPAQTATRPALKCQRKKCVVARAAASILYRPSLETFPAARRVRTTQVPRRETQATTHRTTPVQIARTRSFAPTFYRRRASFLIASPGRSRGPIRAAASRENRGFAKLATVPRSSLDVAARTGPQAVASLSSTSGEAGTGPTSSRAARHKLAEHGLGELVPSGWGAMARHKRAERDRSVHTTILLSHDWLRRKFRNPRVGVRSKATRPSLPQRPAPFQVRNVQFLPLGPDPDTGMPPRCRVLSTRSITSARFLPE